MNRRDFFHHSAIVGFSAASLSLVKESGMLQDAKNRSVFRILKSSRVNVGTLPVMRAFAGNHLDHVSPFVLFDEFGPVSIEPGQDALKVDAHPHAGVTPTTYFVQGSGHHKDSLEYDFEIGRGDFMMFSSGKGAIHMEESGKSTVTNGGIIHGFQIWLNTPAAHKFDDPRTTVNSTEDMATLKTDKYWIQVVLGELGEVKSKVETNTPAFYYHVKMEEDAKIEIPTKPTDNVFIYQISGSIELEGQKQLDENQVALFNRGESLVSIYSQAKSEFLVLGGTPLDETVFSYGPFVMNNEEQIRQCMINYQNGLMGDPNEVNR